MGLVEISVLENSVFQRVNWVSGAPEYLEKRYVKSTRILRAFWSPVENYTLTPILQNNPVFAKACALENLVI